MASTVYFTDLRSKADKTLFDKLSIMCEKLNLKKIIKPRDLVAIKIHFGEKGNTSYVRPIYVRRLVDEIKASGGKPFLTDANTLYVGTRGEAISHLTTAIENGFSYSVVNAPLVIADGLRGNTVVRVPIEGEYFKETVIGAEIVNADFLFTITHFKGHELTGFGGSIKNIGMGSASREGKMAQHSNVSPRVSEKLCVGCKSCVRWCRSGAIKVRNKKAKIDPDKCVGCAECILACPEGAIKAKMNEIAPVFMKKMAEYAAGVLKGKENKSVFFNFITQVSPACDCYPYSDAPIIRDIGVLASRDIVAIDQASVDLVNNEGGITGSKLSGDALKKGADKFRALYPYADWTIQLEHAEKIGLGQRSYRLVKI